MAKVPGSGTAPAGGAAAVGAKAMPPCAAGGPASVAGRRYIEARRVAQADLVIGERTVLAPALLHVHERTQWQTCLSDTDLNLLAAGCSGGDHRAPDALTGLLRTRLGREAWEMWRRRRAKDMSLPSFRMARSTGVDLVALTPS
ncbi:hypothetical protein [Thauera sp.]|uniref:hypothetical protein n=1 Tax=Thauera sp. TaxID=1905334 RepID=UPI0039E37DDC